MWNRLGLVTVLCILGMAITAGAASYDYGSNGSLDLTDGSWTLAQSGEFCDVLFSPTLNAKQLEFKNTYGGETYPNRGAYFWTAPEGESITQVAFYWFRGGYLTDSFKAALFSHTEGDSFENDPILWESNVTNAYEDGSIHFDIDPASQVTSIGLGFYDTMSDIDHSVVFNTILITTQGAGPARVPGDANNDGLVDVGDLGILAGNYGLTEGATWGQGDFNGDGEVDVGDLGILAGNYGSGSASVASVPEPMSLSLLALGGLSLIRRRF